MNATTLPLFAPCDDEQRRCALAQKRDGVSTLPSPASPAQWPPALPPALLESATQSTVAYNGDALVLAAAGNGASNSGRFHVYPSGGEVASAFTDGILFACVSSGVVALVGRDKQRMSASRAKSPYSLKVYGMEPLLLRATVRWQPGKDDRVPTALALSADDSAAAIGFSNGQVMLAQGELLRDRIVKMNINVCDEAVASVGFVSARRIAVTSASSGVVYVDLDEQGGGPPQRVLLDDRPVRAATTMRDGALVYCVGDADGELLMPKGWRVPCGEKHNGGDSGGVSSLVPVCGSGEYVAMVSEDKCGVSVMNVRHGVVVYHRPQVFAPSPPAPCPQPARDAARHAVRCIVPFDRCRLVIVSAGGECAYLRRIDAAAATEAATRAKLFALAVDTAPPELLGAARQRYAAHLCATRDYEAAATQFIAGIGNIPPILAVLQLLNGEAYQPLHRYLQALFAHSAEQPFEYVRMLIALYSRYKGAALLLVQLGLQQPDHAFRAIVTQCCDASVPELGLALAQKRGAHDIVVSVLLSEMDAPARAIGYMRELLATEPAMVLALCVKHARRLALADGDEDGRRAAAYAQLLATAASKAANPTTIGAVLDRVGDHPRAVTAVVDACGGIARLAFAQRAYFEALCKLGDDEEEEEALSFLRSQECRLEARTALHIAELYGCVSCMMYLYEQLDMLEEYARLLRLRGDLRRLLQLCKRHGAQNKELWVQALQLAVVRVSEQRPGGRDEDAMRHVLDAVRRFHVMPPVETYDFVRRHSGGALPYRYMEHFLHGAVAALAQSAAQDEARAAQVDGKVAQLEEQLDALLHKPVTFRRDHCAACGQMLALPAVHFFCAHSLHADCLAMMVRGAAQPRERHRSGGDDVEVVACPVCRGGEESERAAGVAVAAVADARASSGGVDVDR